MRNPRTTFSFAPGVVFLFAIAGNSANANPILLLDAPSAGGSYYGMYCTSCIAASFTLAASFDVSTIDLVLRTPATTSFTTFDFSLQNSLTGSITTFVSEALTAPLGVSTEAMNVAQTLVAGTYYLVGNVPGYFGTSATPGDVDGWLLSNGVYNDAAGTVTDGVWAFNGSGWILESGNYFNASSGKSVGDGRGQRAVSMRNRRNFLQVESIDLC